MIERLTRGTIILACETLREAVERDEEGKGRISHDSGLRYLAEEVLHALTIGRRSEHPVFEWLSKSPVSDSTLEALRRTVPLPIGHRDRFMVDRLDDPVVQLCALLRNDTHPARSSEEIALCAQRFGYSWAHVSSEAHIVIGEALWYGLLERNATGQITLTNLGRNAAIERTQQGGVNAS